MVRQIIHIDESKCNGCGICATACHEGAIDMVDGKAKLVRENFCDGFGDCLPSCPTGAITFEEREAPAYDEEAVKEMQRKKEMEKMSENHGHGMGCPGSRMMQFNRNQTAGAQSGAGNQAAMASVTEKSEGTQGQAAGAYAEAVQQGMGGYGAKPTSQLMQWPVQIKLLPTKAPFYEGAKLLIAADCTAFAYANMHEDFMKGKITMIGCPKLDEGDYAEKLTAIIRDNDIKSVTIVRMEVPCCGGLQMAAQRALQASGKFIPWQVVTISRDGEILD